MNSLLTDDLIASLAVEAALHEAVAGPKPGLVDRFNRGAHRDMDLFTFCSSASALHPFFSEMVREGRNFRSNDLTELLEIIRPAGIDAEKAMLGFTGGINTHKGLIFSLGILCAAAGYLLKKEGSSKPGSSAMASTAAAMCRGIVRRELESRENPGTNGEKLFREAGIKGIRGEAEAGFPSVILHGLPSLKNQRGSWNSRLVNTLLVLMNVVEDSNVLSRSGPDALAWMKREAMEALEAGGAGTDAGMEILKQMDVAFTERNMSPGGCADLLAVTIFLYKLEIPYST